MMKGARCLVIFLALSGCLCSLRADTTYRIFLRDGSVLETSRKPVFIYGQVLFRAPSGKTIPIPVHLVDLKKTRQAVSDPDRPPVITDKNLKDYTGEIIRPEGEGVSSEEETDVLPASVEEWLRAERAKLAEKKEKEARREGSVNALIAEQNLLKQKLLEVDYKISKMGKNLDVSPNSIGAVLLIKKVKLEERIKEYDGLIEKARYESYD